MRSFEKLEAWTAAHALHLAVHRSTSAWPKREWYGLASQGRRAAFSVAANIAEGHSRRGTKEYRHFLNIALGSMGETQYVIRCARDLGYVTADTGAELDRLSDEAGRRLWRLFQGVDRKLATDPR